MINFNENDWPQNPQKTSKPKQKAEKMGVSRPRNNRPIDKHSDEQQITRKAKKRWLHVVTTGDDMYTVFSLVSDSI